MTFTEAELMKMSKPELVKLIIETKKELDEVLKHLNRGKIGYGAVKNEKAGN